LLRAHFKIGKRVLGVVMHFYNPSYSGSIGRRMEVGVPLQQQQEILSEK
jgi:hypothetical protein